MRVFVTGLAGFIGFHAAQRLHERGCDILGCDNFNPYYDPGLKRKRAALLQEKGITTLELDICDPLFSETLLRYKPTHVLHLAAQAGVRYSLENPQAYIKTNIEGFTNLLQAIKERPKIKLVYASSSSVYGLNSKLPYCINDPTDQQASFYGVTKKLNELMASTYTHLYGLQATGLRYFTVYGPWGRPDMALFSFTHSILRGQPIDLFNFGDMQRDFTYIDDIVDGTISALMYSGSTPVFNLGNHTPVKLHDFVEVIEQALDKRAHKRLVPWQSGDMISTYADIKESQQELGFNPKISIDEGIARFIDWYKKDFKCLTP
jgi:UDP-glucuronate 4-epimerase